MRKNPLGKRKMYDPAKESATIHYPATARQSPREQARLRTYKSFACAHANVHEHCRHFRRG